MGPLVRIAWVAVRLQAVLCAESEKDSDDVRTDEKGGESELSRNVECCEVFPREPD